MIDLDNIDLTTLEATLHTDKGDMVFGFHADKAPRHVRNFAELAQQGFYDGLAFHRVIRNFMIQGGCPNTKEGASGTPGTGGPGHRIDAEFNDVEHTRGVMSMARAADPNSAGSQFFIVHAEHVPSLDGQYTAFGHLKDGDDVLDAIASVECEFGAGGERSAPVERVEIQSVELRVVEPEAEPVPAEATAETSDESGEKADEASEAGGES
ncbi:MAG: peptidylprolyl isomerase [Planctomycetes bacterium]|nr:peptidylprolyl isomerase [Planctomycetota bacterium]